MDLQLEVLGEPVGHDHGGQIPAIHAFEIGPTVHWAVTRRAADQLSFPTGFTLFWSHWQVEKHLESAIGGTQRNDAAPPARGY